MKLIFTIFIYFFMVTVAYSAGYENVSWGSSIDSVVKKYPNGQKLIMGENALYRQAKPNKKLAKRIFGFNRTGLHTVTVVFEKEYVKKQKLEVIVFEQNKVFGQALVDRSQAPEKMLLQWKIDNSKITLGYSPQRPDMTVMIFERK